MTLSMIVPSTLIFATMFFLFTPPVWADSKLKSFEKEVYEDDKKHNKKDKVRDEDDKKHNKKYKVRDEDEDDNYDDDSFVGELFGELLFAPLVYGGAGSAEAVSLKKGGERTVPFVRLDTAYQNVDSDVYASDVRLEAGYGPIAVWFQGTCYEENSPDTNLDLSYVHVSYRMLFESAVEFDLGVGGVFLDGDEYSSGSSVSWIVKAMFTENFGMELRPVMSDINGKGVEDYTFSLIGGWEHVALQAGYRWISVGDQSLDGPILGLMFTY